MEFGKGKHERPEWRFDRGQDYQESRENADSFHSEERDCIKLNSHGLPKAKPVGWWVDDNIPSDSTGK